MTESAGARSVGSLIASGSITTTIIASGVGRLPVSMIGLALLLTLRSTDGIAVATGTTTAYGVGFACSALLKGRIADRFGLVPVIAAGATVSASALVLLALAPLLLPALFATAVVAGVAMPQIGAATRAVWTDRFADQPSSLRAAFTLDGVMSESAIVIGSAVVSLLAAVVGGPAALLVTAGTTLVGGIGFASTPACRRWTPVPQRRSSPLGPLAVASVRVLAVGMLLVSAAVGALTVALVHLAAATGAEAAGGWLVTATAVGSVAGSVLLAAVGHRWTRFAGAPLRRRSVALTAVFGLALLPLLGLRALPAIAVLLVLAFLLAAPTYVTQSELLGAAVTAGSRNEVFSLTPTTNWAGQAVGTGIAGVLVTIGPPVASLALAPALLLAAAPVTAVGLRPR